MSEGGEYGSKSSRQVRKTNPNKGNQTPTHNGQRGIIGSQDERRPETQKGEPDPHSQRTERGSVRGEGVIGGSQG